MSRGVNMSRVETSAVEDYSETVVGRLVNGPFSHAMHFYSRFDHIFVLALEGIHSDDSDEPTVVGKPIVQGYNTYLEQPVTGRPAGYIQVHAEPQCSCGPQHRYLYIEYSTCDLAVLHIPYYSKKRVC